MFWPIFMYLLIAIAAGASAMFKAGFWIGVCILIGSALAIIGAAGTKAAIFWYEAAYRIGSTIFGVVLLGVAFWLSTKFSIGLFGIHISGPLWVLIGVVTGGIFATRKLTT